MSIPRRPLREPIDVREHFKSELMRHNPSHDDVRNFRESDRYKRTALPDPAGVVSSIAPPAPGAELQEARFYFSTFDGNETPNLNFGELRFSIAKLNNATSLANVVRIKIEPFYIPRVYNTIDISSPEYFYFGRVFIQLMSVGQAIVAAGSRRFHFECDVEVGTYTVKLTPIEPMFYFDNPITLERFDLRLMVPSTLDEGFRYIELPPDRVLVRVTTNMEDALTVIQTLGAEERCRDIFTRGKLLTTGNLATKIGVTFKYVSGTPVLQTFMTEPIDALEAMDSVNFSRMRNVKKIVDYNTFTIEGLASVGNTTNVYTMFIFQNRISVSASFLSQGSPFSNTIIGTRV